MRVVLCVVILMVMEASGDVLVGGFSDMKDEKKISELTTMCLKHLNHATNSIYLKNIVKLVSAKQQVVSGMKYILVLEVGTTACRKRADTLVTDCEVDSNKPIEECTFEVWEQAWKNFRQITLKGCRQL